MESDQEIRPRTRTHRKTKENTSNYNLEKVLDDVQTNEERKIHTVKSDSWSLESKILIFIIAIVVIGLVVVIIWSIWKNDDDISMLEATKIPPGMNGMYIPSTYEHNLARQHAMQQNELQRQAMQQAQKTKDNELNEQMSVKTALKQRKAATQKQEEKTNEQITEDIGPVPGENLDNPGLFKKQVTFKESEKLETIVERNIKEENKVTEEDEEEKRNFLDVAALIGD